MNISSKYFQSDDLLLSNPFNSKSFKDSKETENKTKINAFLEKKRVFTVNTIRRNFDEESLFNFHIKLNPAASVKEKVPIYENNPTLEQTIKQRNLGIYGNINTNYDPTKEKGRVVGHDHILFSGEKGCKIHYYYRNIMEFNLKRVDVPNQLINYLKPSLQVLHASIPELSGFHQIHTTDGIDENVTFIIDYYNMNFISTSYINPGAIVFPVPTNQLNKLNIQLRYPFQDSQVSIDVLTVHSLSIYHDTSGSSCILVKTNGDASLFEASSKIKFENVSFEESDDIRTFLNTTVKSDTIFNILRRDNIGIYVETDIPNFDPEPVLEYSPITTNPKIVNVDLQIQLTFELVTKEDI